MSAIVAASRRHRFPLHAAVLVSACLMGLAMVGLDGWRTWESRSVTIAEDKIETANLAQSLAQQTHDTIQAADTVLIGLRERVEHAGAGPLDLDRLHQLMALRLTNLPIIHGLFIYDAAGNWVVNSVLDAPGTLNNADRPYFIYHQTHLDRGVHLGDPVRSKSDGKWVITVSRRLDAPNGDFAGIVTATLAVDSLNKFYETFDVGKHGVISISSTDGIMYAHMPPDQGLIGTNIASSQGFIEMQRRPQGSFRYKSFLDGEIRLGSYRRLADYPVYIMVAHGMGDLLSSWRQDAILHLLLSTGAAVVIAVLGIRFAAQIKWQQQTEQRYRLLADNSSDAIICIGADGRKLYVSPAFAALTGWSVQDCLTREWGSFVHPDDRAAVLAVRDRLGEDIGKVTLTYRIVRNDGANIWVEASIQQIGEMDGQEGCFVANIRDITKRKAAEDQVLALNSELAAQANTDALTGLANRRSFDTVFLQEWRRAYRDAVPLSLVMIDVDRFKLYNDRYGHQQGDVALQEVAAAINSAVRRPGDFVARYGGEEMVVLLPNTNAAGAALLADRVRVAIEALHLTHAGNGPGHVITASLGAASLSPRHHAGPNGCKTLLESADAALYEAKNAGRNRVVTADMAALEVGAA
jgi:diguanylate cyclase (GGDEF)-like protein/PAS domain S-box-containing protein